MNKRKVQSVIFYCDAERRKHFLLLKVNKDRGLFWQNSTGSVDSGEDYLAASKREAIEETAITESNIESITQSTLEFEFHDRWGKDVIEKVFFIKAKSKWDITLDPSEHTDFKWVIDQEISKDSVHFESNSQALFKCMELQC